jgi:hypothetical protein
MSVEKPPVKFFPGFFLDVIDKQSQYGSGELPHRITLFPPLLQPYLAEYGDRLRDAFNPIEPFVVRTAGTAILGDDQEPQLVRLIEPSDRLQDLHATMVQVLGNLIHDDRYRQAYDPHISIRTEDEIPEKHLIHIGGFSVVEKVQGQSWVVVDKIGLKGDEYEIAS